MDGGLTCAHDFTRPLGQVLKLGFEFDIDRFSRPCGDALTDDRFHVCPVEQEFPNFLGCDPQNNHI